VEEKKKRVRKVRKRFCEIERKREGRNNEKGHRNKQYLQPRCYSDALSMEMNTPHSIKKM
jgi:hypothetical protein